jgi:hypothetical protein
MAEVLLNSGLGRNEINMQEIPNGPTPIGIARFNRDELLKLLLPKYGLENTIPSDRDKLLKSLEAKIKAKSLLPFHEALKKTYDEIIQLFETKF